MRACGVQVDQLKKDLTEFVDVELQNLVTPRMTEPKPTASFQRVVQRAAIHVQSSSREEVTGANVLVAMFSERESHAVYFLQEQDMSRLDAVNYISHGVAKVPGRNESRRVRGSDDENSESSSRSSSGRRFGDFDRFFAAFFIVSSRERSETY